MHNNMKNINKAQQSYSRACDNYDAVKSEMEEERPMPSWSLIRAPFLSYKKK